MATATSARRARTKPTVRATAALVPRQADRALFRLRGWLQLLGIVSPDPMDADHFSWAVLTDGRILVDLRFERSIGCPENIGAAAEALADMLRAIADDIESGVPDAATRHDD